MTIRQELWDVAATQHGYFTLDDARERGFDEVAVRMMAGRNRLVHAARGVYRFPQFPATEADPYLLAVLWTGAPEAVLSHETALAVRGYGDVNPDRIHVTVAPSRRIRRTPVGRVDVHREDLDPGDFSWWNAVPSVTVATAVRQCLRDGTPGYLIRQAIDEAVADGGLTTVIADDLRADLEARYANA